MWTHFEHNCPNFKSLALLSPRAESMAGTPDLRFLFPKVSLEKSKTGVCTEHNSLQGQAEHHVIPARSANSFLLLPVHSKG